MCAWVCVWQNDTSALFNGKYKQTHARTHAHTHTHTHTDTHLCSHSSSPHPELRVGLRETQKLAPCVIKWHFYVTQPPTPRRQFSRNLETAFQPPPRRRVSINCTCHTADGSKQLCEVTAGQQVCLLMNSPCGRPLSAQPLSPSVTWWWCNYPQGSLGSLFFSPCVYISFNPHALYVTKLTAGS